MTIAHRAALAAFLAVLVAVTFGCVNDEDRAANPKTSAAMNQETPDDSHLVQEAVETPPKAEKQGELKLDFVSLDAKYAALYFHRTARCPSCLAIEKHASVAIGGLAGTLDENESQLLWHAVNMDTPGNERFEDAFELQFQSVVLVELEGGTVVRWKVLSKVWELVDMPSALMAYVRTEAMTFLSR